MAQSSRATIEAHKKLNEMMKNMAGAGIDTQNIREGDEVIVEGHTELDALKDELLSEAADLPE